jgi:DNA-binding MarR family transcriptional regulator
MKDQEKHQLFINLQKVYHQLEAVEEMEKKLMVQLAQSWGITNVTRDLTMSEVHVVEQIGHAGSINVTRLAEKMTMTKGAITKINTKLLARDWIEKIEFTGNTKEVHYQLTAMGLQVYQVHNHYHEMAENQFHQFLQPYSDAQLAFIATLMGDVSQALDDSMDKIDRLLSKSEDADA